MAIGKVNSVAVANIAKWDDVTWANIQSWGGTDRTTPAPPANIIIPYTAGAGGAPAQWSLYATANNKFIIGAGSTYAVDDNGAGTGSLAGTLVACANHTGAADSSVSGGSGYGGTNSAGAHSHTVTWTPNPLYQNIYLIKHTGAATQFPTDGAIFSAGAAAAKAGLTSIYGGASRHFRAAAAVTTGGSGTATGSAASSGGHNHGTASGGGSGGKQSGDLMGNSNIGAHTHSPTVTITYHLNAYNLSCWTNTLADFDVASGMIALYENTTPPDGWYLCDGNNGTPDLRDQFIIICSDGSEGTAGGDGTVDGSCGSTGHTNHNHDTGNDTSTTNETANHTADTNHPAHSGMTDNDNTWLPAYYALAYVMKA